MTDTRKTFRIEDLPLEIKKMVIEANARTLEDLPPDLQALVEEIFSKIDDGDPGP